jgi:hypothetical protein
MPMRELCSVPIFSMNSSAVLSSLVLIAVVCQLTGCASKEDKIEVEVVSLEKSFDHHDMAIKAWKSPAYVDGLPQTKMEILVSGPGSKPERWVKLRQNKTFEGLTLESVDVRGHSVGNPKTGMAAVITEDFSLKISDGDPRPFLILRNISGYTRAFYSDEAHPPFQ